MANFVRFATTTLLLATTVLCTLSSPSPTPSPTPVPVAGPYAEYYDTTAKKIRIGAGICSVVACIYFIGKSMKGSKVTATEVRDVAAHSKELAAKLIDAMASVSEITSRLDSATSQFDALIDIDSKMEAQQIASEIRDELIKALDNIRSIKNSGLLTLEQLKMAEDTLTLGMDSAVKFGSIADAFQQHIDTLQEQARAASELAQGPTAEELAETEADIKLKRYHDILKEKIEKSQAKYGDNLTAAQDLLAAKAGASGTHANALSEAIKNADIETAKIEAAMPKANHDTI